MEINIKAKLGLDTIKADTQKHISVDQEICKGCTERWCLYVCPAKVYTLNKDGEIELDLDGCLECGTCKIACVRDSVTWDYPRGGFGVQYKCG